MTEFIAVTFGIIILGAFAAMAVAAAVAIWHVVLTEYLKKGKRYNG